MGKFIRDLGGVALLMIISGAVGGVIHSFRPIEKVSTSSFSLFSPSSHFISLGELRTLMEEEPVVVIDARSEAFYRLGHIPKAINLSRNEFEKDFERVSQQTANLKQRRVVVYCSGEECEDSAIVAEKLFHLGVTNLTVFSGGWEEWEAAGLPRESDE